VRVEDMVDDVPAVLEDEAEDDAKELELLVEAPEEVTLTDVLDKESDEDDEKIELIGNGGIELLETLKLANPR
jgi:hypothetical protein